MASIVSTSRPYGLDNNSSSINTGSNISNNTPTGSVATNGLTNTLSSKKEKRSSSKADSIRQEIYSLGNYFDVASHKRHPILED